VKRLEKTFAGLAMIGAFRDELRPHRNRLVGVGLMSLGLTAINLAKPWPLIWIIDSALVPTAPSRWSAGTVLGAGAAAAALIALSTAGLQYVRALRLAEVGHAVTRSLRHRIFAHVTHLSSRFHATHKTGDLLVRLMGDVPILRSMLVDSPVELVTRLLVVLGTLAVLFAMQPFLTLVVCGVLPLLFFTTRWFSKQLTIAVRKQRRKEGALADFLHEAIAANEVIRSLGRGEHVVHSFARDNRRSARAGLKATRLAARISASVEGMLGIGVAVALFAGGREVLHGAMTAGELVGFLSYIRSLLKPVRSASRHAERIAKGTACGERLRVILDEAPSVVSAPGAPPAPHFPERLTFHDVHFRYHESEPEALAGIRVTFEHGQLTALAGASGAGKSTLARLAVRLDDPDSGEVRLDGASIRELDLASVRECIGLTLQEPVLFGETVRVNLLLGRPDATDDEIRASLTASGAAEFVDSLEDGLDTLLGAGGSGLSGGQRRRLSLARTLLRNAPVLIIDEPFAGLDAAGAERVAASLRALAQDRIVVVIAHDFVNLERFDRVVLIDHGRLVGDGLHRELRSSSAVYRRVVRAGGAA
jgi:ATP-binding cassette subfamily B protein